MKINSWIVVGTVMVVLSFCFFYTLPLRYYAGVVFAVEGVLFCCAGFDKLALGKL